MKEITYVQEIVILTDFLILNIYSFQGKTRLRDTIRRQYHTYAIVYFLPSKNINCFSWEIYISIGRYALKKKK
jgi:hypothetical protein